jgi:hypothetical protein
MLPLYVSIPARVRGELFDPRIAESEQVRIIRSWRAAGFAPVSINTAAEHAANPGLRAALAEVDVETVVLQDRHHGVLCPINRFLEAIAAHASAGPVAITNADIFLADAESLAASVRSLTPSQFLLGQRMDVTGLPEHGGAAASEGGAVNFHGFDFFASDTVSITSCLPFLGGNLSLGQPFWDHFFPLALMATGANPRLVDPASIRHAIHPLGWSARAYCDLGLSGARHLATRLACDPDAASACRWLPIYEASLLPPFGVNRRDRIARRLIQSGLAPLLLKVRKIGQLAAANFLYLLHTAALRHQMECGDPFSASMAASQE